MLDDIRFADLWPHATDAERRTPARRAGRARRGPRQAPHRATPGRSPLRVAFDEVGLKHSGLRRVGGAS